MTVSDDQTPARRAFLTIASAPNSTEATSQLLRALAGSFSRGGTLLRHTAAVLEEGSGRKHAGDSVSALEDIALEELREAACAMLNHLAESGDNSARHAVNSYRGSRTSGARPIDDSAALAKVETLEQQGPKRQAVGKVAPKMAEAEGILASSVAHRIRRKRRKNKTDTMDLSVSVVR